MIKEKHITVVVKMVGVKHHTNKAKETKTKWNCLIEGKVPLDIVYDGETKYDTAVYDFVLGKLKEFLPGNDKENKSQTIKYISHLCDEGGRRGTGLRSKLMTRGIDTIKEFEITDKPYDGEPKGFDSWIDLTQNESNWIAEVNSCLNHQGWYGNGENKISFDFKQMIDELRRKHFDVKDKEFPVILLEECRTSSNFRENIYSQEVEKVVFKSYVNEVLSGTIKGENFIDALNKYEMGETKIENFGYKEINALPPHTRMIGSFNAVTKRINQTGVIDLDDGFTLLKNTFKEKPKEKGVNA